MTTVDDLPEFVPVSAVARRLRVRPLRFAVPCRGFQRLWELGFTVEQQVNLALGGA